MRLFDTYTRELVELPPPPGPIRMYFCGPTVYQRIHIGNARPFVLSMWLKRWLEQAGYDVRLAENITDINDKIYAAAPGASAALAAEASRWYIEDTDLLGLGRPDHEPKATETIPEIVELIGRLVDRGLAYPAGGDVYFRVAAWPDYGRLSGRLGDADSMRNPSEESERAELKEDPRDFALWKAHKEGEDTWWDSPWGRGRPGWHIECSAMSETLLGLDFDLHGGGSDLVFPHHENEIAQTEAGRGKPLARLWMHNGMVRFEEEKMAKSVGNVTLLGDALDRHGRDALLMYFLRGHYRQPLAYSDELVEDAARAVERIANFCRSLRSSEPDPAPRPSVESHREAFFEALRNDFNTPRALAELFELISDVNREGFSANVEPALAEMLEVIAFEHLLEEEAPVDEELLKLAAERDEARRTRDFDRADRVRDELRDRGYEVRDTPEGPELVPISQRG